MEQINKLLIENRERELKKLILFEDEAKRPFHILSFKGINELYFIHEAFIENKMLQSKEYLFKIALTNSYYHEKFNGEIFNVLDTFTYPILCDNRTIICRYLGYSKTEHPDSFSTYFGKGVQSILRNDLTSLKQNIDGLKRWCLRGWAKYYSGVIIAFEGFYNSDVTMIINGIQEIIASHKKQEHSGILKEFINIEATTIAKLAWFNNIKIKNMGKLVPDEFLPIIELPNYTGYDFFKELKGNIF